MSMQSKGFKFWQLKGQCVGIKAVYVLVSITSPLATVQLSLNLTLACVCRCSRSQILPGNSRVTRERTTNRSS